MKTWFLLLASLISFSSYANYERAGSAINDYADTQDDDEDYSEEDYGDEEDDFYGDEDFVSIATGTRKAIHKAPAVASVITADDIEKMGAISVFDILESVVGLHIYPSNFNRMNSSISLRGIHTAQNTQVLIFVNGIKTTYGYVGGRWELFNVAANIIDRIEVIRGPGSAVYGADAFSGVINIITKDVNSKSDISFGTTHGSFDTSTTWFNYVNSDNELKTSVNAQYFDTDGDKSRVVNQDSMHAIGLGFLSNAPGPLDTRKEMIDIHAQLAYKGFNLSAWYLKNDAGTGAGAAQALSNNDYDQTKSLTFTAGYKWQLNNDLTMDFKAYHQSYEEDVRFVIYPPGMLIPKINGEGFTVFTEGLIGSPTPENTNYGANIITSYSGLNDHNLRFEIGYQNIDEDYREFKNFGPGVLVDTEDIVDGTLIEVFGNDKYMPNQERRLEFISIQDEWQLAPDWDFTIGGRYDKYSDFGSTFNPRLALVWQTDHNLTTKFLYGEAFRAPSFSELYATNNPIYEGNRNLEPETINTYEISWDYRPTFKWKIIASLFSYEAKKLIIPVPNNDTGLNDAQNADNQSGHGVELEFKWQATENIDIAFGGAYQSSETSNTGQDIADAPGKMFNASIDWRINRHINLHLDTRWIMDRTRLATDTRAPIDDYNWTNLALRYEMTDNTNFKFTIRNLFDSDAREPSDGTIDDYPLEKRGYWLTLQHSF